MTSEEVSAPLRNAQSEAVAVKAEQLREQGVEVLRRLSTAKVSLSDASFIAGWVTDARKALTHPAPPLAVTDEWRDLITDVRDLIRAAWALCDNTANENPPEVDQRDWDALSRALDKLDQLPNAPGFVYLGPASKVEHALTRPAPSLAVTDAMVEAAAEALWTPTCDAALRSTSHSKLRAALTAALEAK